MGSDGELRKGPLSHHTLLSNSKSCVKSSTESDAAENPELTLLGACVLGDVRISLVVYHRLSARFLSMMFVLNSLEVL